MRNKQLASCKYFELLEINRTRRICIPVKSVEGVILIVLCFGVDFVLFEPYVRFHSFS